MNHDRLFKELISSFFYEFLELFFPGLAEQVDDSHAPIFLDKESFGELPGDSRREKDLVVRVRLRKGEACFIVHLEHEAQNNRDFPQRMHLYFARLLERYGPPIYPIAVFSRRSRKPRPGQYRLAFHDLQILDFRYRTLELAELNWSEYLNRSNPVASALMARMKIARGDRPRVKVQCLRMLATLRVDPNKSAMLSRFIDTYLVLNRFEVRIFYENLETLPQEERQAVMRVTTSWKEEGRLEGIEEGRRLNLQRLRSSLQMVLSLRFGDSAGPLLARISQMDVAALDLLHDQLAAGAELPELVRSNEPGGLAGNSGQPPNS